jgi:transcription antitermination factor NusG
MAESNWYAVYTRPCWEKKVSTLLDQSDIVNYCPLQKSQRQWSDRTKTIYTPLFKSYVFVQVKERDRFLVRQINGIINFVSFLGRPAVIKNEEIDTIKKFHNQFENIQADKIDFEKNDRVKIVGGLLMNLRGNVMQVRNKYVEVYIPSLGYILSATINKNNLVLDTHASQDSDQ